MSHKTKNFHVKDFHTKREIVFRFPILVFRLFIYFPIGQQFYLHEISK